MITAIPFLVLRSTRKMRWDRGYYDCVHSQNVEWLSDWPSVTQLLTSGAGAMKQSMESPHTRLPPYLGLTLTSPLLPGRTPILPISLAYDEV